MAGAGSDTAAPTEPGHPDIRNTSTPRPALTTKTAATTADVTGATTDRGRTGDGEHPTATGHLTSDNRPIDGGGLRGFETDLSEMDRTPATAHAPAMDPQTPTTAPIPSHPAETADQEAPGEVDPVLAVNVYSQLIALHGTSPQPGKTALADTMTRAADTAESRYGDAISHAVKKVAEHIREHGLTHSRDLDKALTRLARLAEQTLENQRNTSTISRRTAEFLLTGHPTRMRGGTSHNTETRDETGNYPTRPQSPAWDRQEGTSTSTTRAGHTTERPSAHDQSIALAYIQRQGIRPPVQIIDRRATDHANHRLREHFEQLVTDVDHALHRHNTPGHTTAEAAIDQFRQAFPEASDLRGGLSGGGSSIEAEINNVLITHPGANLSLDFADLLASGPGGARIVTEAKYLYFGPGEADVLYRTSEAAAASGGTGEGDDFLILEVIPGVMNNVPGETYSNLDGGMNFYASTEQRLEQLVDGTIPPGATPPGIPLSELFPSESGWTLTDIGRQMSVTSRPIGDPGGTHVHHNIGVPLAGLPSFLSEVHHGTWRDESYGYLTRTHLRDALTFAAGVAGRYMAFLATGSAPDHIPDMGDLVNAPLRDVQELRGVVALHYIVGAAIVNADRVVDPALLKAYAAVLPRHEPEDLHKNLSSNAQLFLSVHHESIMREFERVIDDRIPNVTRNPESVLDIPIPGSDAIKLRDYFLSGLTESHSPKVRMQDFIKTFILDDLDRISVTNPGTNRHADIARAVVEVRSYGQRLVRSEEMRTHHTRLTDMASITHTHTMEMHWQETSPGDPRPRILQRVREHLAANPHTTTVTTSSNAPAPLQAPPTSLAPHTAATAAIRTPGAEAHPGPPLDWNLFNFNPDVYQAHTPDLGDQLARALTHTRAATRPNPKEIALLEAALKRARRTARFSQSATIPDRTTEPIPRRTPTVGSTPLVSPNTSPTPHTDNSRLPVDKQAPSLSPETPRREPAATTAEPFEQSGTTDTHRPIPRTAPSPLTSDRAQEDGPRHRNPAHTALAQSLEITSTSRATETSDAADPVPSAPAARRQVTVSGTHPHGEHTPGNRAVPDRPTHLLPGRLLGAGSKTEEARAAEQAPGGNRPGVFVGGPGEPTAPAAGAFGAATSHAGVGPGPSTSSERTAHEGPLDAALPARADLEMAVEEALTAVRPVDGDVVMGRLAEALGLPEHEVGEVVGYADGLLSPFLDRGLREMGATDGLSPRAVATVAVAAVLRHNRVSDPDDVKGKRPMAAAHGDHTEADARFTAALRAALLDWRDHEDAGALGRLGLSSHLFPHDLFDSKSPWMSGGATGTSQAATGSGSASSAVSAARPRISAPYLQFTAESAHGWTIVESPAHLSGLPWDQWRTVLAADRAKSDGHVRSDQLSQSQLEEVVLMLSQNGAPDVAEKVRDYSARLDAAARAAADPDPALVHWTGREVEELGQKLRRDYENVTLKDSRGSDDLTAQLSELRKSADKMAGALNGFISQAADVRGVYRLRSTYTPVVSAARTLAEFVERWTNDRQQPSTTMKKPVSVDALLRLNSVIREFRRRAAYEYLTHGHYWHLSDPPLPGRDRAGRIAYLEGRSQQNLAELLQETRSVLNDPRNEALYRRLSDLDLTLLHATNALQSIRRDGLMSSLAELHRRDGSHLASGLTQEADGPDLANEDFWFARLQLNPTEEPTSRFGSSTIVMTFANLIRLKGWLSLFDGLDPLHPEAMRELVWKGKVVREASYLSTQQTYERWQTMYPESGTPTHTKEMADVVFVGADAKEGLILHVIAEAHRIGGEFLSDMLNETDPKVLWHMVSRMIRPEAKLPSSPLEAMDRQSADGIQQIRIYSEDAGNYHPDGTYRIPVREIEKKYAVAFSIELLGLVRPTELFSILVRRAATATPESTEIFRDEFERVSGMSLSQALDLTVKVGKISSHTRSDLLRELIFSENDLPMPDFSTGVRSPADLTSHPGIRNIAKQLHEQVQAHRQGRPTRIESTFAALEQMHRSRQVIQAVLRAGNKQYGEQLWISARDAFSEHSDRIDSLFGMHSHSAIQGAQLRPLYDKLKDLSFRHHSGEEIRVAVYPEGNSSARVHLWSTELDRLGIDSKKIAVARGDRPLEFQSADAPGGTQNAPRTIHLDQHIAPLVEVYFPDSDTREDYVLDPILGRGPLTVPGWLKALGISEDLNMHEGTAEQILKTVDDDHLKNPGGWTPERLPREAEVAIADSSGPARPTLHGFPRPGWKLMSGNEFSDHFLESQDAFAMGHDISERRRIFRKLLPLVENPAAPGTLNEASVVAEIEEALAGELAWPTLLEEHPRLDQLLRSLLNDANYEHITALITDVAVVQ
ncbi:hypothetical protein [Streptomyces sp. NPDC091209]|uniref:hypothetical protein n=1 Tax=Streptomyces sp. NPDC091209 TaxID=3365974 RepID=UPI0038037CE0